jgi:hypothetical protein
VRPAKYPIAIANTKQQIAVNCVSTIVYRRIMPLAVGTLPLRLRYAIDQVTVSIPAAGLPQYPDPY